MTVVALREMSDEALMEYGACLVKRDHGLTLEILDWIVEVKRRDLHLKGGKSQLCSFIAARTVMTPDQAKRRSQAANVIIMHPEARDYFIRGELDVSHLTILAPHITPGNGKRLLAASAGRSANYLRGLVHEIDEHGRRTRREHLEPLTIWVSSEERENFAHARNLLTRSKAQKADDRETLDQVTKDFIERRDPVAKAKRAAARIEKKLAKKAAEQTTKSGATLHSVPTTSEANPGATLHSEHSRKPIPMSLRHAVILRDGGRCTYVSPDGVRCGCKEFLELNHIIPVALGGTNTTENLEVVCRAHNNYLARLAGVSRF